MSKPNDGGPAFPAPDFQWPEDFPRRQLEYISQSRGMSLRDWFAGLSLQGMIFAKTDRGWTAQERSAIAYEYADAMIAERHKGTKPAS